MKRLSEPQWRALRPFISAFPDPIDVEESARESGYEKGEAHLTTLVAAFDH